ncbi:MAG: ABC transporter ATP-binding protein [Egibacteraceae bacterium]
MSASEQSAVRVRGLVQRYGRFVAVDHLDLDVPRGAVFGLIGPNGAGKTTTMRCLATLLVPSEGTITVCGADPVTHPRDVRRAVGWMPDVFGLYDGLTCAEYLDFFAAAYGLGPAQRQRRTGDLLELVELGHKRDADVAQLSRGMQQRLGLARTLVHDPALLILDEPASGLDPRARIDLREILLELARQGKTILISSHILSELGELCDRVGIIEAGRMLAQGTPDEIRHVARASVAVVARVLGGEEALMRAARVAAEAGAQAVRAEDGLLRAELADGQRSAEEAAADLLAALVAAGVRIADYREQQGSLERLFLKVTDEARAPGPVAVGGVGGRDATSVVQGRGRAASGSAHEEPFRSLHPTRRDPFGLYRRGFLKKLSVKAAVLEHVPQFSSEYGGKLQVRRVLSGLRRSFPPYPEENCVFAAPRLHVKAAGLEHVLRSFALRFSSTGGPRREC